MNFANYFEMASFSLPRLIKIKDQKVGLIDMQFELGPSTLDTSGRVMNQGSKFIAKIPDKEKYIAYNGKGYASLMSKEDAIELLNNGYQKIPDNWWEKARFL